MRNKKWRMNENLQWEKDTNLSNIYFNHPLHTCDSISEAILTDQFKDCVTERAKDKERPARAARVLYRLLCSLSGWLLNSLFPLIKQAIMK
jgi:hypothetical protein